MTSLPKNAKVIRSFETSETADTVMQRDIPEGKTPQPHLCENLKTHKGFFYWNVKLHHEHCSFPLDPSGFLLLL